MATKKYDFDVIALGDATLDTFLKLEDANVLCSINQEQCWLCLNYADKIPVSSLQHSLGGNAANLAVGAARLGLVSAIYTELGDDDTGGRIIRQFEQEGVDLAYVKTLRKKSSNYSVVINFKSQRTILGYHQKREYHFPKLGVARFIYLTSMGEGCESVYSELLKYLHKNGTKLCFAPGTYQRRSGFKNLEPVISNSYLFISNKEEACSIFSAQGGNLAKQTGQDDKSFMKDLLYRIHRYGPEVVVVTDGPKGAYCYDGENYYYAPIIPVEVVEPTGAGDSFSTGLIAGLVSGKKIDQSLVWAAYNSTSVIGHVGAQTGLLNQKKMREFHRKYSGYKVELF
ncbi:MAG: putative Ribokinase [Parcubacteria group bacterium Gr01-1014_18]|nr:MAG: putative Ribokinase [Parcubacteria group bacterium Greene0416_36]TSC80208.1 MAG: putative Ribokinase [Parcubacteria group bacterium Gr01-1014_18]TSC98390.1 MAG: putative Ribokinase [Parcubacteria group bacterium Greene1014_20]TSD06931.1 MAG: putative Ribokinase [Parcubacteria group bacterium Greene0714_2]